MISLGTLRISALRALGLAGFGAAAAALTLALSGQAAMAQSTAPIEPDPVRETFNDWQIRCKDNGFCYMHQVAYNSQGSAVLSINISKFSEPQTVDAGTLVARAEIITPLEVYLPAGLGMRIDEGQVTATSFLTCNPLGCIASPPLQDTLVDSLKNGGAVDFLMRRAVDPEGTVVGAKISLSGFTAAFDAL